MMIEQLPEDVFIFYLNVYLHYDKCFCVWEIDKTALLI